MRSMSRGLLLLLVALLISSAALASINGSISGLVTDPSGAVVVGAEVIAIETQTGIRSESMTDGKGFYSFPTLPIGKYDLEIHAKGFKTHKQQGLVIDANSALRVDVALQLGETTEQVSVTSDAVMVETQNTQMGEVITGTRMTTVPLNGRSYTDLLSLQPGVVPSAYGSQAPGLNDRSPSGNLNSGNQSVNGQREAANGFMVNGGTVIEGKNNGAAVIPNLDSISEFRIITNNFDAEYGNFSGGQINVATKSGTNNYHGSLFEFFRNTDLNTRNFYNPAPQPKGAFDQNQYGGTLGGPVKKDKVFFFVDYQGTRQTVGQTVNTTVPTAANRGGSIWGQPGSSANNVSGDYWASLLQSRLQSTNPGQQVVAGEPYWFDGCTGTNYSPTPGNTGCVFPTGTIPQTAWSPAATGMLPYIPEGDPTTGAFNTSAYSNTLNDNKGGIRGDANTKYGLLSAYYFIDDYTQYSAFPNGGATVPGFASNSYGRAQLVNLGLTTNFGATSVNEFRFSYMRNAANLYQPAGGLGPTLSSLGFTIPNCPANSAPEGCAFNGGVAAIDTSLEGVPNVSFNNYAIGVPSDTVAQYNNTFQWQDTFSKVVGTHSLKMGGSFHYDQINERNFYGENGSYGFYGGETGSDFADFLLGAPDYFIQASHQVLDSRSKYLGLFFQDSWRVKPSLTFNYGLRYEISLPWYDTQNKIETIIPGEQSVVFPNAPTGWLVPHDPNVPRTLAPPKYNAFSPRLGLAYSPSAQGGFWGKLFGGPGKTSIRAGFGIYYTSVEDLSQFLEVGDSPYGIFWYSPAPPVFESPFLARSNGLPEPASGGNPFPFVPPPTNVSPSNPYYGFPWGDVEPISSGFVFWYKNRMPYSEHYELSLQRQFGSNTVFSASFVGNQGHKLITSMEANPGSASICLQVNAILGDGTCSQYGENTQYTLPDGTPQIPGAFYIPGTNTITGTRTVLNPAAFGSNPYMKEVANSAYNSLQLSLRHTSSRAEFLLGYTYGKCLDNSSGLQDSTNPFDPKLSRSLCAFNVTQNFVISYNYNFEFDKLFHASHGFAKGIASGWSLSGITTFATGLPISLGENDDNSLTGAVGVDEPQLTGNTKLFISKNPRSGQPYFNPDYFTYEPIGQVGNANRRFFSGPGLNNFDMAIMKNTAIGEGKNLQFRVEAFNVFNHAQFYNPNGTINSGFPQIVDGVNQGGLFGMVTGARDPRLLQLAAKFTF